MVIATLTLVLGLTGCNTSGSATRADLPQSELRAFDAAVYAYKQSVPDVEPESAATASCAVARGLKQITNNKRFAEAFENAALDHNDSVGLPTIITLYDACLRAL